MGDGGVVGCRLGGRGVSGEGGVGEVWAVVGVVGARKGFWDLEDFWKKCKSWNTQNPKVQNAFFATVLHLSSLFVFFLCFFVFFAIFANFL